MLFENLIEEMKLVQLNKSKMSLRKQEVLLAQLAKSYWGDKAKAIDFLACFLTGIRDGTIKDMGTTFNPNGFRKIQIAKVGTMSVRLHVFWPEAGIPEQARVEENAHDHRWSLNSTLLCGKIVHTILGVSPQCGELLHKWSYSPRGNAANYSMSYCGPVRLKAVKTIEPAPFIDLSLNAYVIHKVAYKGFTATLCVTHQNRNRDCNDVYTTKEVQDKIRDSGNQTPAPFIPNWTETGVRAVLAALK